jgi:hypothetical protein
VCVRACECRCFLSWRFAVAVGRSGRVLAIDTDPRTTHECNGAAARYSLPAGVLQPVPAPSAALAAGEPAAPQQLGLSRQHAGALDAVPTVSVHLLRTP